MDMDTLKSNVKKVIKLMPPEVQLDTAHLFHIIVKHMPVIEKVGPQVMEIMAADINTLALEFATGMLNKEALNVAMTEAFAECGIVIPDINAPIHPGT